MGTPEYIVSIVIFNAFFLFFIFAVFMFIQQYRLKKKEHLNKLKTQLETHQKEILSTQIEIQSQTMQDIGREIHDNIGQKLTLASIHLQQLEYDNAYPNTAENIKNISEIIKDSLSGLRALSKTLTDDIVDKSNITELLKAECTKINKLKVCQIDFISNTKNIDLNYQTKSILYRVAQEFLQNSIKYSKCSNLLININFDNNILELTLSDNGIGFDINNIKSNGIGLSNMKKRTELIGGKFEMESSSKGTVLIIKLSVV